ncbi:MULTISPECIES: SPW repeat domain-containing protein [Streptomyces]|jgi:peptidoglycan/LPS O-acetylase OafA/YrhL|uniref:SPW repeat-containing protein n=1 Tax=Streptomyces radiopugnans TaxID=403935 RepID=A0A1H9F8D0_9ACTN|nr:SPW repeat protein [Streptomyces radiopugnans]SEQ33693.1 SPW repeat-containing protein [Streptomyces radiopugnans]
MARHSSPRGPAAARGAAPAPGPTGVRDQLVTGLMMLAGIWLVLASWFLRYPFSDAAVDAQRNETGVGIVLLLTASARIVRPRGWLSDLIVLLLGLWLLVAPALVDYGGPENTPRAAQANEVVMGIVLVVLALVSMLLLFRARRMSPEEAR